MLSVDRKAQSFHSCWSWSFFSVSRLLASSAGAIHPLTQRATFTRWQSGTEFLGIQGSTVKRIWLGKSLECRRSIFASRNPS